VAAALVDVATLAPKESALMPEVPVAVTAIATGVALELLVSLCCMTATQRMVGTWSFL